MAIFKVGQRVRFVRLQGEAENGPPIGAEGVIVARASNRFTDGSAEWEWIVDFPTAPLSTPDGDLPCPTEYFCDSWNLAPLTDPSADAFIASIKAMRPYEEPKVGVKEGVAK